MDVPLLSISTAGIFDDKKVDYDDWDAPNPLGHYARPKFAGELFVKENVRRHLVCRAGWKVGDGSRKDKKFVQIIIKQLKAGATELHVVDDKFATPTYTHGFAKNVRTLLESERWGVYNIEDRVTITPVSADYFREQYFAQSPASERLVNTKLEPRNLNRMRDWRVALGEYLDAYYGDYLD